MKKSGVAFIGIDTAKLKNAVALAEAGRDGEIRYLGEFENTPDDVAQLIRKLASRYKKLHVCYTPTLQKSENSACHPARMGFCSIHDPRWLP